MLPPLPDLDGLPSIEADAIFAAWVLACPPFKVKRGPVAFVIPPKVEDR